MAEYITTRTYYSKKLDEQTYAELTLIAKRLGILRKIIWHQFSSDPKRLNDRKIRDIWLKETEFAGTTLIESPKIDMEFCFTKDASILGYEKVSNLGLFNRTYQSRGESELKINTEFLNSISGIDKE